MMQTKKLVYGTQRGLNKAVELRKAKGWSVVGVETIPRGATGRQTFIAYLKRDTP